MATTKRKTHRGAAKRFRKTATGKFKRSHAMKRHILTKKNSGRLRAARQRDARLRRPTCASSGRCSPTRK